MTQLQRTAFTLVISGLVLFAVGLVMGFAVINMPASKPILSAHQAALGSGTFLMVLGLVWRLHMKSQAPWLATGVWISHYLLTAGIALNAVSLPHLQTKAMAGLVTFVGCILMTLLTLVVLMRLRMGGGQAAAPSV